MKTLLLILSLLLSPYSDGKTTSSGARDDSSLNREICISAAQGQTFAGDGVSNSVSIRTPDAGRRTSPQTRSTFRVIKGGKVIDNNRTHPFLTPAFVPLSGMHISERYLFSICRLRL